MQNEQEHAYLRADEAAHLIRLSLPALYKRVHGLREWREALDLAPEARELTHTTEVAA